MNTFRNQAFVLRSSRRLTADVFEVRLAGDASSLARPGQFVNIALPDRFLRRPLSVAEWTDREMTLLVRVVGAGTRELVSSAPGTAFDILLPLGNGFDFSDGSGEHAVLAGGGIGIAPLYGLARRMAATGLAPDIALGFRNAADAFYLDEFRALGLRVLLATEDGSLGLRGFVTEAVRESGATSLFACGPMPMLRALHALPQIRFGQYSFEARMGCGFGACVGCTIQTTDGPRRVCCDGPVFRQ